MLFDRTRALWAAPLCGIVALTAGCSSSPEDDASEEEIAAADANAELDVVPLDIWAQSLPQNEMTMTVTHDGKKVRATEYPVAKIFLRDAGRYSIHLDAPMHEAADVELDYDGSSDPGGVVLATAAPRGTGVSLGHATRDVDGRDLPAHSLFLGLRHTWFSAQGRPARRGNKVSLFMDGQEAWSKVRADLVTAKRAVNLSTWWWESGFEMTRDLDPSTTVEERWPTTILGTLEALPATKRVLVGQFWGQDSILSWVNTDAKLRRYATAPNDAFEFMGQANETKGSFAWNVPTFAFGDRVRAARPEAKDERFDGETPIASTVPGHQVDLSAGMPVLQDFADGLLETASYHQKFITVDSKVAFVGGMNLRQNDWDTSQHSVYDPRRMSPGASVSERMDVAGKIRNTDAPPRKDYMVRVEGPAAQDVDDVFHERWEFLRKQGVKYSENTSAFDVKRDIPAAGTTELQVTTTLPAPFNENAIAETWFNAVRNAKKYIYIEDQYFRIPMLDAAIAQRMTEVPDLKIVVITMDVGRTDPACARSREAYGMYKSRFPDRAFFLQLRTFDGGGDPSHAFVNMDTHSKMLIVDDTFVSVGSCNKNNRGIIYEGEMNVAIADAAFVTDARNRIVWNLLGSPQTMPTDWIAALVAEAAANDQAYAAWGGGKGPLPAQPPTGFAYSLVYPRLDDCLLASVGPDRT
jgi:hypothetical protein